MSGCLPILGLNLLWEINQLKEGQSEKRLRKRQKERGLSNQLSIVDRVVILSGY